MTNGNVTALSNESCDSPLLVYITTTKTASYTDTLLCSEELNFVEFFF